MRFAISLTVLLSLGCAGLGDSVAEKAPGGAATTTAPAEVPGAAATPGAVKTAPSGKPSVKSTAAVKATAAPGPKMYEGSYLGVCQRMADCNCPEFASPQACAVATEGSIKEGLAMMQAMGMKLPAPTKNQLFAAANLTCERACNGGITEAMTPGMPQGGVGTTVHGGGATTTAEAGPNGARAAIQIENDDGTITEIEAMAGPNGIDIKMPDF